MKLKDARIKLMNEVLNGIKVCCYICSVVGTHMAVADG